MASSLYADLASFIDSSGRSFTSAACCSSATWLDVHHHENFWAFLSLCQGRGVDLFPITWHSGLGLAGTGGQGRISQSDINWSLSFVFKRWKWADKYGRGSTTVDEPDEVSRLYRAFMSEVLILSEPAVRECPYVVCLEGVCWERVRPDLFCPVLVFERAPCGDLSRLMASDLRKKFDVLDRLKMCEQIAIGLSQLHRHYVVHGDLNPVNVLVFKGTGNQQGVTPRITDFGYSTIAAADDACIILGTKEPWNAPEVHHRGFVFNDAVKTDIFSLGLLCFWLLFYEELGGDAIDDLMDIDSPSPMVESENIAASYRKTVHKIHELKQKGQLKVTAIDLVERKLGVLSSFKKQICRFFEQTLDANPADRCCDLEGLLSSIGLSRVSTTRTVENLGSKAQNSSAKMHCEFQLPTSFRELMGYPDYRFRKFVLDQSKLEYEGTHCERCSKAAALLVSTSFEIGFGGLRSHDSAISWSEKGGFTQTEIESQIALLRSEERQKVYSNWQMRILLYDGAVDFGSLSTTEELEAHEVELTRELVDIEAVLGKFHNISFNIRRQLASIAQEKGDLRRSRKLFATLVAEIDQSYGYGPTHPTAVQLRTLLAALLARLGHVRAAKKCAMAANRFCLENPWIGPRHTVRALVLETLSGILALEGRWSEAEKLQRRVIRITESFFGARHPRTLHCRFWLGEIFLQQRNLPAAERLAQRNHAAAQRVLGARHPDTLAYLVQHAEALYLFDRWKEAEGILNNLLDLSLPELGHSHPVILRAKYTLGLTYYDQERFGEALELLEAIQCPGYSSDDGSVTDLTTLTKMQDLALVYLKLGKMGEGRDLLQKVMEYMPRIRGRNSSQEILATIDFAAGIYEIGEYDDAEELQESCLARCTKHFGTANWLTVRSMANLANTYLSKGKYEQAEILARLSLEGERKLYGNHSLEVISTLSDLALTLVDRDKLDEGLEMQKVAYKLSRKYLGAEQPETRTAMRQLAQLFSACGRSDEADSMLRRVIAIQRRIAGDEDVQTICDVLALALLCLRQGRVDEGTFLQGKSLKKTLELPHQNRLSCLKEILETATAYNREYMHPASSEFLCTIADLIRDSVGEGDEETLRAAEVVAGMHFFGGLHEKGMQLHAKVLEISRRSLGEEDPDTIERMQALARSLCALGRCDEAVRLAERALGICENCFGSEDEGTLEAAAALVFSHSSSGSWQAASEVAATYVHSPTQIDPASVPDLVYRVAELATHSSDWSSWDDVFGSQGFGDMWDAVKGKARKRDLSIWLSRMKRRGIKLV